MHLKACPALARSELRVEACPGGALLGSQQAGLLRTCSGHRGNGLCSSRLPLGVISTNTLRRGAAGLQLAAAPQGCENRPRLLPSTTEDDAPLDIMTVIRPGHVREKIAIFASEEGRAGGGALTAGSCPAAPAACVNTAAMTASSRAPKAKGSWEEKCSAKRRRRSGNNPKSRDTPRHAAAAPQHAAAAPEEAERKVSVGDIVAFLEQRVSEQPHPQPPLALQRSSASITLSRAPPPEPGEAPEVPRVSDMVARLESERLQRSEGGVSRSSSLRRAVGRVLLVAAAADRSPSSSPAPPSPSGSAAHHLEPLPLQPPAAPPRPAAVSARTEAPPTAPALQPEEAEPPPGLLFLSAPPPTQTRPPSTPLSHAAAGPCGPGEEAGPLRPCGPGEEAGPLRRHASASRDFLQLRLRLQQLLQPQPFLWALPHHLLLQVLHLLPTRSLAALQCTCSYFKVVMETYGVRPTDSLWVSDPRYRDDPCKQCKRRYRRGDVSLCRWHHKPFCQALPGGPGYWMCCRGNHRDSPGCNVGLHDNNWVPSFHSVNVPIRRSGHHDE